jgi:predicted rRNA methylase YqxC with S4 and FtsJ domains
MHLYKKLIDNNLVINEKEYQELILMRQIKVNNQRIYDPKLELETNKKYFISVGILDIEI